MVLFHRYFFKILLQWVFPNNAMAKHTHTYTHTYIYILYIYINIYIYIYIYYILYIYIIANEKAFLKITPTYIHFDTLRLLSDSLRIFSP